jgi:hypothetical protein
MRVPMTAPDEEVAAMRAGFNGLRLLASMKTHAKRKSKATGQRKNQKLSASKYHHQKDAKKRKS